MLGKKKKNKREAVSKLYNPEIFSLSLETNKTPATLRLRQSEDFSSIVLCL